MKKVPNFAPFVLLLLCRCAGSDTVSGPSAEPTLGVDAPLPDGDAGDAPDSTPLADARPEGTLPHDASADGNTKPDSAPPDAATDAAACLPGGCNVSMVADWNSTRVRVIRSDGVNLFLGGPFDAAVSRVPVTGGTPAIVGFRDSSDGVFDIVLEGQNVYACVADPYLPHAVHLLVMPKSGGAAQELVLLHSNKQTCAVASDGTSIYFAAAGSVVAVDVATHATRTVLSGGSSDTNAIAVDATNIYLAYGGQVSAVSKNGGTPQTLWTSSASSSDLRHVVTTPFGPVWFDGGEGLVHVYSPPGPARALNPANVTQAYRSPLDADATEAFWASGPDVWRAPLGGGAPTQAVSGLPLIDAVAIDGARLYFSVFDAAQPGFHNNAILSVPR